MDWVAACEVLHNNCIGLGDVSPDIAPVPVGDSAACLLPNPLWQHKPEAAYSKVCYGSCGQTAPITREIARSLVDGET